MRRPTTFLMIFLLGTIAGILIGQTPALRQPNSPPDITIATKNISDQISLYSRLYIMTKRGMVVNDSLTMAGHDHGSSTAPDRGVIDMNGGYISDVHALRIDALKARGASHPIPLLHFLPGNVTVIEPENSSLIFDKGGNIINATSIKYADRGLPTCIAEHEGEIRYNGTHHIGCNGERWRPLYTVD